VYGDENLTNEYIVIKAKLKTFFQGINYESLSLLCEKRNYNLNVKEEKGTENLTSYE
jgi:hypothetical protein